VFGLFFIGFFFSTEAVVFICFFSSTYNYFFSLISRMSSFNCLFSVLPLLFSMLRVYWFIVFDSDLYPLLEIFWVIEVLAA